MGWTGSYNWTTYEAARDGYLEELAATSAVNVLKRAETNRHGQTRRLWLACRTPAGVGVILLVLFQNNGAGWMCKEMDETVGPVYHDCPLDLLDATEPGHPEGWRYDWRRKVREYHKPITQTRHSWAPADGCSWDD